MPDLDELREELDRTLNYQLQSENALLAQRRRTKELEAVYSEQKAGDQSLPPSMRS